MRRVEDESCLFRLDLPVSPGTDVFWPVDSGRRARFSCSPISESFPSRFSIDRSHLHDGVSRTGTGQSPVAPCQHSTPFTTTRQQNGLTGTSCRASPTAPIGSATINCRRFLYRRQFVPFRHCLWMTEQPFRVAQSLLNEALGTLCHIGPSVRPANF